MDEGLGLSLLQLTGELLNSLKFISHNHLLCIWLYKMNIG